MSTFLRYLLSLAMNLAWQRAGKGGAIPPMRLPGKGKAPVNLPMIGPWQMMAATWVIKRIWARHGTTIKTHLQNNANDITRRAAQYIPDPKAASSAATSATSSTRAPANVPIAASTPSPTPRPAPSFDTQVLGGATTNTSQNNAPVSKAMQTPLPQGSILGKLRGRS